MYLTKGTLRAAFSLTSGELVSDKYLLRLLDYVLYFYGF